MKWAEREILLEQIDNAKKFLEEGKTEKAEKQLEAMLKEEYIPKKKIRELVSKYDEEEAPKEPLTELGDLVTELKMMSKEEPEWDSWTEKG